MAKGGEESFAQTLAPVCRIPTGTSTSLCCRYQEAGRIAFDEVPKSSRTPLSVPRAFVFCSTQRFENALANWPKSNDLVHTEQEIQRWIGTDGNGLVVDRYTGPPAWRTTLRRCFRRRLHSLGVRGQRTHSLSSTQANETLEIPGTRTVARIGYTLVL